MYNYYIRTYSALIVKKTGHNGELGNCRFWKGRKTSRSLGRHVTEALAVRLTQTEEEVEKDASSGANMEQAYQKTSLVSIPDSTS